MPVPDDVPPTPEDRLREVAAILAAGVLRLRARPSLAAAAEISGAHVAPKDSADSAQNCLELSAPASTDPLTG